MNVPSREPFEKSLTTIHNSGGEEHPAPNLQSKDDFEFDDEEDAKPTVETPDYLGLDEFDEEIIETNIDQVDINDTEGNITSQYNVVQFRGLNSHEVIDITNKNENEKKNKKGVVRGKKEMSV